MSLNEDFGATELEVKLLKSRIMAEAPENQEFLLNLRMVISRMEACWNNYLQFRSGGPIAGSSMDMVVGSTLHRINQELSAIRRMVSQMLELLDQRKRSLNFGKHAHLATTAQPNPGRSPGGPGNKFVFEESPVSTASSFFAPAAMQFPAAAGQPFQQHSPFSFSSSVVGYTPASESSVSSRTDITYGSTGGGSSFTGSASFVTQQPPYHYRRQ